jgi:hypothetical protein
LRERDCEGEGQKRCRQKAKKLETGHEHFLRIAPE